MERSDRAQGFRARLGRAAVVFSRPARYRRGVGLGLAACVATVLAAMALPVPTPDPGTAAGRRGLPDGTGPQTPAPEDLTLFLESRRWGGETLRDVRQRVARAEAAAAKRRATDKVGLVGLVTVKDRRASLIRLPDGAVARFVPGDTLPDGRGVKTATDRTVTLEENEHGQTEVLDLFPPIPRERGLAGPDAEARRLSAESSAKPAG